MLSEHANRLAAEARPGDSSLRLLHGNADALKVRLALVDLAAETLDIQYFIWQDDATGRLLLQHVIAAADRGVRVRLLLDDLALGGRDPEVVALEAHPSVQVRVFNPWTTRSKLVRPFEFVVRPRRLNRRMHNKTLIADGRFGILGGRNIGDRYFGVYAPFVQNDLDIMMAGPVLAEVVASFDEYWNSSLTVEPAAGDEGDAELVKLRRDCARKIAENAALLRAFAVPIDGWSAYLDGLLEDASRGPGELFVDSPGGEGPRQLYPSVKSLVAGARRDVLLSSPYLIPDRGFVDELAGLVARGVRVRVLTNSLASNSHVIAHSGYKKWRRQLLGAGVELYEMRADPAVLDEFATSPAEPEKLALHAKAIVVDGRRTFIGSPNIDPRSMVLNTEIGLVADDPALAGKVAAILERDMRPENSWRVTLDSEGWLHWQRGDEVLSRQPALGFKQRAMEFFMNLIPIKNQT
ncbi:MAG TPA: phospholipase D family protein [Gammaproteobacteria bacterium]|nr:phospholipase D family protein [Gammaproteobacteria bacterium]